MDFIRAESIGVAEEFAKFKVTMFFNTYMLRFYERSVISLFLRKFFNTVSGFVEKTNNV